MTALAQIVNDPFDMARTIRARAPRALSLWGMALNLPQAIGGLIFITRPLGLGILISWAVGMIFAGRIFRLRGLSPWISLCHVTWLPLFPFLILALLHPEQNLYYAWLVYVTLTITASLIMDFRAVYAALAHRSVAIYEKVLQ